MNGQRLLVINKFTYLGNTLSRVVHIDGDITVSVAFGRPRGNVWDRSGIRLDTNANPLICMWDLDSVPTPYQKTWAFPLKLPEKTPKVARRNAIKRHPKCISEWFQHTTRVLGTECTGSAKVAFVRRLSLVRPTGVQLLGFCCSSVSVLALLLSTQLVSFQYWIFWFGALMSRSHSRAQNSS